MKEVDAEPGEHISRALERLVAAAPAFLVFNGTRIDAAPGDTADDLFVRWSAERERRQREIEATPEYKAREAALARARAEEAVLRAETLRAIDLSGVRTKFPWEETMGEISGFGGGYEAACRDMVYAGLAWLENFPKADLSGPETPDARTLEKQLLAACPDCSGAMLGATKVAVAFVARNGWAKYVEVMTKRERER